MIKLLLKLLKSKTEKPISQTNLMSSLAPKTLTSKDDIDKIQPYLDKLKETIESVGINNIALTGGYGSGKSTILKTFRELNPQFEFLSISLASFNNRETDNGLTELEKKLAKEEFERLLEVSILQQIIYHVGPREIPASRFKRIVNVQEWEIWSVSFGFVLWISSLLLLFKYDYLDKINPSSWDTNDSFDWFALIINLIFFAGLALFSRLFVNLFSNSKINKVNIKGELELGENVNQSVFNEHLEEILYFFERTEYNVVLIEDLDRFDSTDIFTKLREINILLNNSKLIKREIKFIYAVGDDLFNDKKERVKFFEYIIPVIPFINSSNADEQLITLLKAAGLDEEIFTKEFISDVTTFIDDIDMRLLTNIFHEFVIYRKILKPEFIKKNDELFAIITYKNLDPRDFTELNRKEGKLYKLINSKRNYIEKYLSKINEEIMLKNSKIDDFEKHMIEDTNELRAIYINRVQGELQKTENTGSINIAKLIEDEGFRSVLKGKVSFEKFATDHSYYQKYTKVASDFSFDFKELQNAVNSDFSYEQRLEMIKAKGSGKIEMLKKEIEKLKSTRSDIENWDLTQIFEQVNISEYLKEFNNNGLVRNFILNGHINENYNDYISLFHGVTITKEDLAFERNVKGGYYTSFNYQLSDKIESLIARLDGKYFRRDLVLNFDLVDFLGKNYSEYSDKYDSIISLLSNEKEKSIQFIDEYIEDDKRQLNVFIEKLVEIWTGFWDYIYSKYSEDRKTKYLELIIQFAKIETILKGQNNNGSLKLAIEERKDFLLLVKNTEKRDLFDKTLRILKELDIKFEKLDYPNEETRRLFDTVYRNNHYLLNEHNILQMLTIYAKEHQVEKFYSSNYSAILGSECKPLIDYINSSKMHYVEEVYLALENNNYEDESNLILLLNDEDITIQSKASIIKKVETRVVDLSSIIQFDVKTELLECKKLIPNWRNVINYYSMSENTINENLINYLNDEATFTELSKFKLNEKNEDFEGILIKCKELLDVAYSALLNSVHYNWKSIDFENLNIEKVLNLLDNKLITTKSNYDRLREYFPKNHIALIEKNFAAFLDKQDDFVTDENDVLLILMSDKISIKDKFTYASTLEENLILGSLKISQAIGFVIIQNSIAIKFVYSTIEAMVKASELRENKVRLINLYSDSLNNSELIGITSLVGWNYKELFKKQHKPIFNDTLYNQELFKILTVKGLIKRYGVDKKDNSKIRVIANY